MAEDKEHKPFHQQVADRIIEQLRRGTAPWQKPWEPGDPWEGLPVNALTGNRYKGINAIQLMLHGYSDSRWCTYNQAQGASAQVRKREHGTPIQYWKFTEEQTVLDKNGNPVLDDKGKPVKQEVRLERPRVFHATVFNAEQIDGLPPLQPRTSPDWSADERAEQILQASGANIRHAPQDRAFYRVGTDSIHMPEKGQFATADRYYATALHELGHWTGNPSRLNRPIANPFGSEEYAKEELRAEIASMITGQALGIGHDPGQHIAYVETWIKALQEDPLEIVRAASDAEKIHEYVMGFEQQRIRQPDQHQTQEQTQTQPQDEQAPAVEAALALAQAPRAIVLGTDSGTDYIGIPVEGWSDDPLEAEVISRSGEAGAAAVKRETDQAEYLDGSRVELHSSTERQAPQDGASAAPTPLQQRRTTVYIDVPYKEKEQAKALGARWDRAEQSWYVPPGIDLGRFEHWPRRGARKAQEPAAVQTPTLSSRTEPQEPQVPQQSRDQAASRHYLAVPYEERHAAKTAGARWDPTARSWYVGPSADLEKLERWSLEKAQQQQNPAMTPREEFADALCSIGCVVSGEHPIMDGRKHRITVQGERHSEKAGAGFYVGHLDGHPAGYMKNNRTGAEMKWKSKGYSLSDEQKAALAAEAAQKLQARAAAQQRTYEATAQRLQHKMERLTPVTEQTPYMRAKGIAPLPGIYTTRSGKETVIPAIDVSGKQWTLQYVQEDGTKRFAKDSRKEGCFYPVGGMDALKAAPALVIGEGFATAASLSKALGFATVAAFDSGNLPAVARALHQKMPDKPIVIAGDDDEHLVATLRVNPGRKKAEEAAQAVRGRTMFPIFAPGERNTKDFTDFNDLAIKSALGPGAIERQARAVVYAAIEQHEPQKQQQAKQQERQPQRQSRTGRRGSTAPRASHVSR